MNHLLKHNTQSLCTLPVILLLVMCIALLASCSKAPSNSNITYTERLGNTVNAKNVKPKRVEQLKLLPPSQLNKNTVTLGILQLAGLGHCKLNILISEHNNQLGKTATAAGRLKYQISFIQSAQACLNTLDKNSDIYSKILAAKTQKENHLIQYFNSMLFNEPELNRTWAGTNNELSTQAAGFSDTQQALSQLVTIKQHITSREFSKINTDSIFIALEQLNKYQFNQLLIQSARQQIAFNNSATSFVKTLNLRDICPTGKNKKTAKIVSNVFQKFFLGEIQPYQAQLTGYLEVLQPLYNQLWFKEEITSEPINDLTKTNSPNNLLNQLKNSAKNHVVWWQTFYKTCEISPI
ncbi:DUF3080 family protein [Pseudoalteromonas sp. Z9A5]|uniref:DUF3080 family protein n=1 Tax=Pseudoalteromonas sp. Z9A5 TaxID=2686355 RepID=UPI00140D2324|nr:DUF3080 family protein [Pseudoalteromonas sp. Z9A5]